MKILVWDGSGLMLYWKRLKQGAFRWPPVTDGVTSEGRRIYLGLGDYHPPADETRLRQAHRMCGKSACCVRRGGDWKRGMVEMV